MIVRISLISIQNVISIEIIKTITALMISKTEAVMMIIIHRIIINNIIMMMMMMMMMTMNKIIMNNNPNNRSEVLIILLFQKIFIYKISNKENIIIKIRKVIHPDHVLEV